MKLRNLQGQEIKTYQELVSNLHGIEGSSSRGKHTLEGNFTLNEEPVVVFKHWSYDGNFGIYTGANNQNKIGEIITGEWFAYLDENGNQIKDEHGIYNLVDSVLSIELK